MKQETRGFSILRELKPDGLNPTGSLQKEHWKEVQLKFFWISRYKSKYFARKNLDRQNIFHTGHLASVFPDEHWHNPNRHLQKRYFDRTDEKNLQFKSRYFNVEVWNFALGNLSPFLNFSVTSGWRHSTEENSWLNVKFQQVIETRKFHNYVCLLVHYLLLFHYFSIDGLQSRLSKQANWISHRILTTALMSS